MTGLLNEGVLVAIIAFSRIGGCFLVIPVFSGMRVPVQVRILLVFTLDNGTGTDRLVQHRKPDSR